MFPAPLALLRLVLHGDDAAATLDEHPPAKSAVRPDPYDRVVPSHGVHDTATGEAAFGKADPLPDCEPGVTHPVPAGPGLGGFGYHWRSPGAEG
jgi:hypothetical protein